MLALFAFGGDLPAAVLGALPEPPLICEMEGVAVDLPEGLERLRYRLETLGTLLAELKARGVRNVCFAGALRRPEPDPALIDEATLPLVPQMMAAIGQGDDGALRAVLAIFEDQGFTIRAPHQLAPDLLPPSGYLAGGPGADLAANAARAEGVLRALSGVDVGQSCVVADGQVIAIEAAPGTAWMLGHLDDLPSGIRARGGLVFKAPKAGQDRRIDLPVIGPDTLEQAASAGLSAVVVQAGGVMILQRDTCIARARELGLTLWVRP